ncbi:MAG: tetratricopeptide repeat protein [Armatimonadetes bacterium]|nr:tetratricopeptide repeat protein [Armatimonadota bacterium]
MPREQYTKDYRQRRGRIFELKKSRRYAEALEEILQLRADGARTANLLVDQADALARLDRPAEALELLEDARLEFDLSEYGRGLLAGLLVQAGRLDEGRDLFERLASEPVLSPPVARRVVQFFLENGRPERAVSLAERLASGDPAGAMFLARALDKAGQPERALDHLRQALARWPEDEPLFLCYVLWRLRDEPVEVVLEELGTLLSMPGWKQNPRLRVRLALALRKAGELERAEHILRDCAQQNPDDSFLLSHLGHVYRDLGRPAEAADVFERVLNLRPQDRICWTAYLAACQEAAQRQRAAALVARLTSQDRAAFGWLFGAYKKRFRQSKD